MSDISKVYPNQNGHYSAPLYLRREGCRLPVMPDTDSSYGFDGHRRKLLLELDQLNQLLDTGLSTSDFFNTIVKVTADNSHANYVSLAIRETSSMDWGIKAKLGTLDPDIDAVCHQILATDACALFENSKAYLPSIDSLTVNDSQIVLMCVPFFVDGQVVGGMTVVREGPEARFSWSDINLASIMGQWSSLKLANIGLLSTLKQSRDHEQQLLTRICRSQEEERRRVSAELHDGVAQWMVSAAYEVSICQSLMVNGSNADTAEALQRVKETLQTCLKELRRAIANLRPLPIAELGLVGALNQITRQLTKDGLECSVHVDEKLPAMSVAEESTVFWIIQEALNNIHKHARATSANIEIEPHDAQLTVRITDDGIGFDAGQLETDAVPLQRLGLIGMKERAELLGGDLSLSSNPGKGTEISLTFKVISSPVVFSGGQQ